MSVSGDRSCPVCHTIQLSLAPYIAHLLQEDHIQRSKKYYDSLSKKAKQEKRKTKILIVRGSYI